MTSQPDTNFWSLIRVIYDGDRGIYGQPLRTGYGFRYDSAPENVRFEMSQFIRFSKNHHSRIVSVEVNTQAVR